MQNMTALNLLSLFPVATPDQIVNDPQGMTRAAFGLLCAVEQFAEQTDENLSDLAKLLLDETIGFYDMLRNQSLAGTDSRWLDVASIFGGYQRMDRLFGWVNNICSELPAEHWLAKQSWTQVQNCYDVLKPVVIKKMRRDM